MTSPNSREGIEEIVTKMLAIGWDSKMKKHDGTSIVVSFTKAELCELLLNLQEQHHQELQKARHDWLREEIVKLEGMKVLGLYSQIKNNILQTIIDRYQSELDQPTV